MIHLRNMRTTAELRANSDPELPVSVRAKRRNVPSAWDDIRRSRRGRDDRGKNHRRR